LNVSLASWITAARRALAALLVSAALQFAWFLRWPGNPMYDVSYSIFAAQNLLAHGQLQSLNMLADYHDNLAQYAQVRWMVHFPPGQSLLYAAAMGLGLSAGAATKALGLAGVIAGGVGWICLARRLGAPKLWIVILAALYPWLPYVASVYQLYETEQVAVAIMPWFCLLLLQIPPVSQATPDPSAQWPALLGAVLLALVLIATKYSMASVMPAAALYLVAKDGRRFAARRLWWKGVVLGLLVFPGLLFLLVNDAYGERLELQPSAQSANLDLALQLARNFVDATVARTIGWQSLAMPLARFGRMALFGVLLDIMSIASLAIWIAHAWRRPPLGPMRSFALLLLAMTLTLWLSLGASTVLGHEQWNFSADARLYMPVTLLWLLWCAVSLAGMRSGEHFRSVAFYCLALPLLLTLAVTLWTARQAPNPAMPRSGLAWVASRDPGHAAFLSGFAAAHGRGPDLLIGGSSLMNELRAPGLYNGLVVPAGHHYWSSTPLEVWTLTTPSQEAIMLADFAGAASDQRIATPPGYPYVFHIFAFGPAKGR
jgi:hypothetical protein